MKRWLRSVLLVSFVRGVLSDDSSGDPACPCVTDLDAYSIDPLDFADAELSETLGDALNSKSYGLGCAAHDIDTPQCNSAECDKMLNVIPAPLNCDLSWCQRSWCIVDPVNCSLLHRRSPNFPYTNRFYSYATCGDADSFTKNNRLAALQGRVLKVGLNSNSGGWLGAYSTDGAHFEGPITKWSGPLVDFLKESAVRGGYLANVTQPPAALLTRANDFFNSTSSFDYCVYATSLGYLDLCLAQYTVTDLRAASTDWLMLSSQGIYLTATTHDYGSSGSWQEFMQKVSVIFQPFTYSTWLFIIIFVIPVLACLMIVHEYGKAGSQYPKEEVVVVTDNKGKQQIEKYPVSWRRTIVKSIYIAFLAVLQQSYEQSVTSIGAMLNLLGISFFILTIIAVYTANLAAILTQKAQVTSINNLDEAIAAGYRFCSERKNMETVTSVYRNVNPDIFAVDPIHLGGDGLPGFNCGNCKARTRVFDMLDPILADSDPRYCHVALSSEEDIELMHSQARHCNKTLVGTPIQLAETGIPIFEHVSPELISFMLKMKNEGLYDRLVFAAQPVNQCPVEEGGEGSALSVTQLSGIWVVSFGFAFLGLLVTFLQPRSCKRLAKEKQVKIQRMHRRDQRGSRVNVMEDTWVQTSSFHIGRGVQMARNESWPTESTSCRPSTAVVTSEQKLVSMPKFEDDDFFDEDGQRKVASDISNELTRDDISV